MGQTRTIWEEGRQPGYQVVALGLAVALTAVALDLATSGRVSLLFDVCFVLLCPALALAVRPRDFFTVGVLPPLVMVVVFVLVGATSPDALGQQEDGPVQAVISGLSRHAVALVLGYALCLAFLAIRQRFLAAREDGLSPRTGPGRPHLGG